MTPIFYMWEPRRERLIAEHQFYVSEGKKRLTDQFTDKIALEKEADKFGKVWLEKAGQHFDPDRHDEGSFCEQAHDEGIQHYQALDELGNSARLALISGMFHLWEKSLREWLTSRDGVGYFQQGEELPKAIWGSNFAQVLELFEGAGLFHDSCPIRADIDLCRLVVNTYKHGSGSSFKQLKLKRPDLFDQYDLRSTRNYTCFADYSDLYVEDTIIDQFSTAIVEFWKAVPENIFENNFQSVPKWFQKAHDKDCKGASNGKKI